MLNPISRRVFLQTSATGMATRVAAGMAVGRFVHELRGAEPAPRADVQQELLKLAATAEEARRARFAAVMSAEDVTALQQELRARFLDLLGGLPEAATPVPPVEITGRIEADGYTIDKLVYESFPGYFVSALLYKPRNAKAGCPAVLSPCGHSPVGKAADTYQILHANLARQGYVSLTYDPVGQAERSQFWDADAGKSRFNLVCGEHAVLGNPLYLLGTSLARYRIWDGLRGLDYLASLPEVDPQRIGCVGNSGGGTLTAYIAALDPRVAAAAICCYITTLPRRMANRIEADPDSDPEQDIFDFVGQGIDHAGLVALRVPRPTLLGTAEFDFFPIAGARESYNEARHIFAAAGAGERVTRVEAAEKHGLSAPLRKGVYDWFGRWLQGRNEPAPAEAAGFRPLSAKDLQVCETGQVGLSFHSRPLLSLAWEQFEQRPKSSRKIPLRDTLRLDRAQADFDLQTLAPLSENGTTVLLVNGNESPEWQAEKNLLSVLDELKVGVAVVDPRGVGRTRCPLEIAGLDYAEPLAGVEANVAYNAFLLGKSLLGMRVTDVLAAVEKLSAWHAGQRIVLCGRRDAALVCCLAAAVEPKVAAVAVEEMRLSYRPLFAGPGEAINAASILPNLLRDFGDIPEVLAAISPRKLLLAGSSGPPLEKMPTIRASDERFSHSPQLLADWLRSVKP